MNLARCPLQSQASIANTLSSSLSKPQSAVDSGPVGIGKGLTDKSRRPSVHYVPVEDFSKQFTVDRQHSSMTCGR